MTKCQACGGTYMPLQPDNARYFHACPLLSDAEVITAIGVNPDRTKWTPIEAQQFAAASRIRPNARNENAPDVTTQRALVAAAAIPTDDKHWKNVNAVLETAIVTAGAGATVAP